MSLYVPFEKQFFAELVAKNGIDIKPSDVVISQVKNISGTTVGETTGANTSVRLTATEEGRWDGKTTIYYDRYLVRDLKVLIGSTLFLAGASTIHELLPVFNARYGTDLKVADFKDGPLNLNSEGNGTVTIVAEPDSLEWVGSANFFIVKGDYSLALQVQKPILDGLLYPDGTMGSATPPKYIAEAYSYPIDFSENYHALVSLPVGTLSGTTPDMDKVVNALNNAEGRIVWMGDNNEQWGLHNAHVRFNGKNVGHEHPTNSNYSHVLVVTLPETNKQFGGDLIMHYSDPDAEPEE